MTVSSLLFITILSKMVAQCSFQFQHIEVTISSFEIIPFFRFVHFFFFIVVVAVVVFILFFVLPVLLLLCFFSILHESSISILFRLCDCVVLYMYALQYISEEQHYRAEQRKKSKKKQAQSASGTK